MAKKKYYDSGNIATTNDMADMPQSVIIKKYPSTPTMQTEVKDGIGVIDSQISKDVGKARGQKQPEKY